jgi:bacterioferritin
MNHQVDSDQSSSHLSDISAIRERARQHISDGAVTPSYNANKEVVLKLLNEALATELVCVLRYRRHYYMAEGVLAEGVKKEFLEHSHEEQEHADLIAERIVQLGGAPNFDPNGLSTRSHAEYAEGHTLEEMITEDLVAERVAIESYREMVEYIGVHDPSSRRLLERILAVEEEHAEELSSMLKGVHALSKSPPAAANAKPQATPPSAKGG